MARFASTVDIKASAGRVWEILTAFDSYAEWNPQIPSAAGVPEAGAQLTLRLALPGRPAMNLGATIEQTRAGQMLSWRGHLLAPWFFEGYREFAIKATGPDRVALTHVEDVHGMFAPVFLFLMRGPIRKSQQALNEALRARAEGTDRS